MVFCSFCLDAPTIVPYGVMSFIIHNTDQQFTNRLMNELNCSRFKENAILDTVYEVFAP